MFKTISPDRFIKELLTVFVCVFAIVCLVDHIGQAALPVFAIQSSYMPLIKSFLFAANASALFAALNIFLKRI